MQVIKPLRIYINTTKSIGKLRNYNNFYKFSTRAVNGLKAFMYNKEDTIAEDLARSIKNKNINEALNYYKILSDKVLNNNNNNNIGNIQKSCENLAYLLTTTPFPPNKDRTLKAVSILLGYPPTSKASLSYIFVIQSCIKNLFMEEALKIFWHAKEYYVIIDLYSLNKLIEFLVKKGKINEARHMWDYIISNDSRISPNSYTYYIFVLHYVKEENFDDAYDFMERLDRNDDKLTLKMYDELIAYLNAPTFFTKHRNGKKSQKKNCKKNNDNTMMLKTFIQYVYDMRDKHYPIVEGETNDSYDDIDDGYENGPDDEEYDEDIDDDENDTLETEKPIVDDDEIQTLLEKGNNSSITGKIAADEKDESKIPENRASDGEKES